MDNFNLNIQILNIGNLRASVCLHCSPYTYFKLILYFYPGLSFLQEISVIWTLDSVSYKIYPVFGPWTRFPSRNILYLDPGLGFL